MDDLNTDDQNTVNILSIDPGTHNLGYALYKLDIETLEIVEAFAWTITATRSVFYLEETVAVHGEKFARILAHKANFKNVLDFYKPLVVICETPFFNMKRASAAGPLYELFTTIEQTLFEWDSYKPLYKIDPKTVKKSINATHNAKKPEMKEALSKIKELKNVCLDFLDEHSIDALAIGYSHIVKTMREKKETNNENP